MNEKEKQIEEMAYSICNLPEMYGITKSCSTCGNKGRCKPQWKAEKLYAAGYRKQSEVAENIIAMLRAAKPVVKVHFEAYDELIGNIAAEYGVEVEK